MTEAHVLVDTAAEADAEVSPAIDATAGVPRGAPRWPLVLTWVITGLVAILVVAVATWIVKLARLEPASAPAVATVVVQPGSAGQAVGSSRAGGATTGSSASTTTGGSSSPTGRVDAAWAARVAAATGIPTRALLAYASADLTVTADQPGCGLGWNTLAAIGAVESGHGGHGGARLGADGYATPAILGPVLDGGQFAAVPDSDGGRWDGDEVWDRAVGPLQFLPSTWARWGADGSGDGVADPNQIDDAALAAGRYLCASGSVTSADGWRAAVLSYNHSDAYADEVAALANRYADAARGVS